MTATALLTDGTLVTVRELGPGDVAALLQLHRTNPGTWALLYLAARFAHKRIRMRRWANEWARIGPGWTGR